MTLETLINVQFGCGLYLGIGMLYWNWRYRKLKKEIER